MPEPVNQERTKPLNKAITFSQSECKGVSLRLIAINFLQERKQALHKCIGISFIKSLCKCLLKKHYRYKDLINRMLENESCKQGKDEASTEQDAVGHILYKSITLETL